MRFVLSGLGVTLLFGIGSMAHATIACEVVSPAAGAKTVPFYPKPTEKSDKLRAIPLGDLVFYPDEDLAPDRVDGWVWVRHDATQEAVFQQGEYGWLHADAIDTCG